MRIGTTETVRRIAQALERREPFSLVRMADGEMRAMQALARGRMPDGRGARDGVAAPGIVPGHSVEFTLLDVASEHALLRAGLQRAHIIGMGEWMPSGAQVYPTLLELLGRVRDPEQATFTDTYVSNYMLCGGQLWELLAGQRILLINDQPGAIVDAVRTGRYSDQCRHFGIENHPPWNIVATLRTDCAQKEAGDSLYESDEPESEWRPLYDYLDEASALDVDVDFDIALVGFSWRAVALCPLLAQRTGKVVLDMGHALREIWIKRIQWSWQCSWGGIMERAQEAL